jgi:hypothetical protein
VGRAMMFLIANLLILVANVGLLAVTIKVYSEVLKIQHIKQIGKVA